MMTSLLLVVVVWSLIGELFTYANSGRNRCPNVAFIMHSNNKNTDLTEHFSLTTFLIDVNVVIVTGHDVFRTAVGYPGNNMRYVKDSTTQSRRLIRVEYNGNPGNETHFASYKGTHRTMLGLLIANDTFPEADFFYVFDDDNYVFVNHICENLNKDANAQAPLLLSGAVGEPSCHALRMLRGC